MGTREETQGLVLMVGEEKGDGNAMLLNLSKCH